MTRLRIYNPDRLTVTPPRRSRWLQAAIVDLAILIGLGAVVLFVLRGTAHGAECHLDQATGNWVCSIDNRSTDASAFPVPIVRVTAVDREVPASMRPPGSSQILDSGTGTLIFDDGRRAIVLSCFHNFRNTSPPYRAILAGRTYDGRLLATDPENDLSALEIAGGTGVIPIQIHDGPLPAEVCACGFGDADGGYRNQSVCGPVTSTPWSHEGFRGFSGQARQGDSGGPVFTREGRLVGVLWGTNPEMHEVMFCCDQPLRRFLDKILPGRPAVIVPHATTPRPTYQLPAVPSRLPPVAAPPQSAAAVPPPADRPGASVPTATGSAPAGISQANSRPPAASSPSETKLPMPASVVAVPPARIDSTAVSVSAAETGSPPAGSTAPPFVPPVALNPQPSTLNRPQTTPAGATSSILDRLGTVGAAALLTWLGLPAGGAAIAWMLMRWLGGKELKRLKDKQKASSAASDGLTEETFHIEENAENNSGGELLERDTREAEALLRLRRLEGRDPFQDSIRGGLVEDILANHAESSTDPQRAQYARDLQYELLKKFNSICPTKLKVDV